MDREEVPKAIKCKQLEDNLKQDFVATLEGRISRYQELDFIKVTPKGTRIGERSREGLTDQRYTNPQDSRIQERRLKKALDKLSRRNK